MQSEVRFFLMKLSTSILNECLKGCNLGKHTDTIRQDIRLINQVLPEMRHFSQDPRIVSIVLQYTESFKKLGEKLVESDWENMSLLLNLIDQIKDGQVLVVEKEQFDQLERQLPAEEIDSFNQTPQL
jgi:hypothetical protein